MIEIDSLRCDFDKYPYSVRTFARQIILRGKLRYGAQPGPAAACWMRSGATTTRRASSSRGSRSRRTRICRPSNADGYDKEIHHKGAGLGGTGSLRRLAGRISPDMRVAIILVMLAVFGALSVYMTVSSIYRIGRNDGKELGIEHIRRLQLPNDSIINPFESGRHGTGGEVE